MGGEGLNFCVRGTPLPALLNRETAHHVPREPVRLRGPIGKSVPGWDIALQPIGEPEAQLERVSLAGTLQPIREPDTKVGKSVPGRYSAANQRV